MNDILIFLLDSILFFGAIVGAYLAIGREETNEENEDA